MKKSWKTYYAWAISPTAIGIYITLILIRVTISFYGIASHNSTAGEGQSVAEILYLAHQKSIDYRLRVRGPRAVPNNLALLTIDEKAVNTIGRWPWPRELIAKAVDNAFALGAKQIAFDMAFPEPSLNPAEEVLTHLKKESAVPADVDAVLKHYSEKMDNDKILGAALTRHADRIVAGSFYTTPRSANWPPETEFCRDMIFKKTPAAKQWDHEEVLLSTSDPYLPYMPAGLQDAFQTILDEKEKAVRETLGKPANRTEEVHVDQEVQESLHETCNTILEDFKDALEQIWKSDILPKENPKEFTFQTYSSWLEDYRQKSVPNGVSYADDWLLNTPVVAAGTKHTGHFNTKQDPDGTIRSKALVVRSGNSYFPAISLKSFLVANGYNASPKLHFEAASGKKEIVDLEVTNNDTGETVMHIPTDRQGNLLINYAGPAQMFPYLSFADLLNDSPEAEVSQYLLNPQTKKWERQTRKVSKAEFIKDKIFIAGATAIGIYDLRVTPFEENFPGTETHLNALENMMSRNFFQVPPNEKVYMPLVLGAMGIALSLLLASLGAIWGLVLAVSTLVGIGLYDQYFLFNKGIVVAIIWPIFLTVSLYVALTFYRYLTEERGKKELRGIFQKYVSPAIGFGHALDGC